MGVFKAILHSRVLHSFIILHGVLLSCGMRQVALDLDPLICWCVLLSVDIVAKPSRKVYFAHHVKFTGKRDWTTGNAEDFFGNYSVKGVRQLDKHWIDSC